MRDFFDALGGDTAAAKHVGQERADVVASLRPAERHDQHGIEHLRHVYTQRSSKPVYRMKPTSLPNPKEKIEELGRRIDRLHRSVLEPDVLRGLLPIKSRLLPYRMRSPEARLREDRFRAASAPYTRT